MRDEPIVSNEDENIDPLSHLQTSATKSRTVSAAKNDNNQDVLVDSTNHSHELLGNIEYVEFKSISKNPFYDSSIVESLLNFVGEKSLKRIKDRITSDLPDKEAKFLLDRFSS